MVWCRLLRAVLRPIFPALSCRQRNSTRSSPSIPQLPLRLSPPSITPDTHLRRPGPAAVPFTSRRNGAHYRLGRRRPQEHGPQARAAHCPAREPVSWQWRGLKCAAGERAHDSDGAAGCWYVAHSLVAIILRAELLTRDTGKGTQAPRIKDKFCACHLVRLPPQLLPPQG